MLKTQHYDVFNGDADGIIALLQLRLAKPKQSVIITGVKRDISLLKQVDAKKASSVTVLDISLEKNIKALTGLLDESIEVFYVDHHRTGDIPQSLYLKTLLNTDANICTSLLVNEYLNGRYVTWAIAAAFGDNMHASAQALANKNNLTPQQQSQLNELGVYINYNGYGANIDDLHFHPADLYQQLSSYSDPFELINEPNSIFAQLKTCYQQDMAKAQSARVIADGRVLKAILLEDKAWARRVSGVLGNDLANQSPDKAHVVVTLNKSELNKSTLNKNVVNKGIEDSDIALKPSYTVSLRAPLNNKQGAGELCAQFPSGGGRAAAAGINALPHKMLGDFLDCVAEYYQ
ncbi:MAG: DHH family phosphoesterase [Colwellia sp.]